ncbi:MAG: tRNA (adenosine(37)-N6)-threonylcarbamoyltransferase complex ATPase subunit type 1 TsaE [Fidelibacterota bacterium]
MELSITSVDEMQTYAADMAQDLPAGTIIALIGELGSGKTTFCQGLARGLGVIENVTSPTFKLVSEYRGERYWFYHVDCYRLSSPEEFLNIDGEKYLSPNQGISAIEWADKIEMLFSDGVIKIIFSRIPGESNSRNLKIYGWVQ